MATKAPKSGLRLRLRSIHLPDLPPLYPTEEIAKGIHGILVRQILEARAQLAASEAKKTLPPWWRDFNPETNRAEERLRFWLQHISPPPAVISYTPSPTYFVGEAFRKEIDAGKVEHPGRTELQVSFPKCPFWNPNHSVWKDNVKDEKLAPRTLDPLSGVYLPRVVDIKGTGQFYGGPGQIILQPVIDLEDTVQCGSGVPKTQREYEQLLQQTTIAVLEQFNIKSFTRSGIGTPDIWVDVSPEPTSRRPTLVTSRLCRIATIHASLQDGVAGGKVVINVGQPSLECVHDAERNPWSRINQEHITTSVVAVLSAREKHVAVPGNSIGLQFGSGGAYTDITPSEGSQDRGSTATAPLGLNNWPIVVAWKREFARQLGLNDAYVDYYWGSRDNKSWRSRPVSETPWVGKRPTPVCPVVSYGKDIHKGALGVYNCNTDMESGRSIHHGRVEVPTYEALFLRMTKFLLKSTMGRRHDTRLKLDDGNKIKLVKARSKRVLQYNLAKIMPF